MASGDGRTMKATGKCLEVGTSLSLLELLPLPTEDHLPPFLRGSLQLLKNPPIPWSSKGDPEVAPKRWAVSTAMLEVELQFGLHRFLGVGG